MMKSPKTVPFNLLIVGILISSLSIISFHHKYLQRDPNKMPSKLFDFLSNNNASSTEAKFSYEETNSIATATDDNSDGLVRSMCFPFNSQSWLESQRLSNQNDSFIDDDFVTSTILSTSSLLVESHRNDQSQRLLQLTLCDERSRILTSNHTEHSQRLNKNTIHFMSVRLLYWAIHVHQHKYAIEEAEFRLKQKSEFFCDREANSRHIGPFDFECPRAKFLIVSLKQRGLGAIIRLNAAPALIAGIASDRVVLFVNNSPVGPKFVREPWMLASCPRKDKQCFFLPDSPCVLTIDELQTATQLGKSEKRQLFKTGRLPDHMEDVRVVIMDITTRPQRIPSAFQSRVTDIVQTHLIRPLIEFNPQDPRIPLMTAAADNLLEDDDSVGDLFYYYGRHSRALHAMSFFAMRPRFDYTRRIDEILQRVLYETGQHEPDLSLGLPIRASDKCIDESECLSFEQYMQVMQTVWDKHEDMLLAARGKVAKSRQIHEKSVNANIILTSESEEVDRAQRQFESQGMGNSLSFPFIFIKNSFDVRQDTGNPNEMGGFDEEDILLSSIVALKMQFHARFTVGNCCSNFHLLLFDFLTDGCGAAQDHIAECLQDHDDPRFRICCGWSKTDECQAKEKNGTANID